VAAIAGRTSVVTVEDSLFEANEALTGQAPTLGGGIFAHHGRIEVKGSRFRGNRAVGDGGGAAIAVLSGSGLIVDSQFEENEAWAGGAMWLSDGEATIRGCSFADNIAPYWGGGLAVDAGGPYDVEDSIFQGNSSDLGGAFGVGDAGGWLRLSNVLMFGNRAGDGAALGTGAGQLELAHCTMAGNVADDGWTMSQVSTGDVSLLVSSSILWNESALGEIETNLSEVANVHHSLVRGGFAGDGNLDADPQFVDADGGDLHLGTESPCINAGDPESDVDHDLEGNPRTGAPDMGAYEGG
jgi:hypothetical protein